MVETCFFKVSRLGINYYAAFWAWDKNWIWILQFNALMEVTLKLNCKC